MKGAKIILHAVANFLGSQIKGFYSSLGDEDDAWTSSTRVAHRTA